MGTLKPLATQYVRDRTAIRAIGPDRRRQLDYWLRLLDDSFGDRPLSHLTPSAIERWLATLVDKAPETRSIARGCANAFCGWLVREGTIRVNPVDQVPKVKIPDRSPRTLTPDEHARLLDVLPDERARAIVAVAFGLGLRRAELARLGTGDFDPHSKTLLVHGKGDKERTLPVPDDVEHAITVYLKTVGWRSGPLFRSQTQPWRGLTPARIGLLVSGWMYEAGIKARAWDGMSLHTGRRTVITEVIDATNDPQAGQQLAGHAHISTTYKHYVKNKTVSELRVALEARRLMLASDQPLRRAA